MHTSQRVAGTSVPSGWRAAAALHHTAKLSMSCQLCGEAKGPATLASSSRSSMALASLHAQIAVAVYLKIYKPTLIMLHT